MKLPQLEIESTRRAGGRVFLAVAAASIVGSAPVLAGGEIREEPSVRKHEGSSPASRKTPHELGEETRTPNGLPKPPWRWQHVTGDWGGARPQLDERGVILDLSYTGEVFSNLHGGIDTEGATEYRGNVDLTATLDTERLGLWCGGTIFFYLQNGHGEGITEEHVGDVQTISNLDAHDFTQISEYWVEQSLFGDQLRIVLGKQDANADFGALDYGGDFINSSFGVIPTVPMPTFPDPALGAVAFLEPADWMALGAGMYDGAPDGGSSGFDTAFDGEDGGFGIVSRGTTASTSPSTSCCSRKEPIPRTHRGSPPSRSLGGRPPIATSSLATSAVASSTPERSAAAKRTSWGWAWRTPGSAIGLSSWTAARTRPSWRCSTGLSSPPGGAFNRISSS
jgi:hypothetical protein